jgi:hypothetical protein
MPLHLLLIVSQLVGLTLFGWGQPAAQAPLPLAYVSPRPGAMLVSADTAIAIRQGNDIDAATVQRHGMFAVSGSQSGAHSGRVLLADDRQTVIFEPAQPFAPGETVSVVAGNGLRTARGAAIEPVAFQFGVSSRPADSGVEPPELTACCEDTPGQLALPHEGAPQQSRYFTLPDDFPTITVTVPASNTAPGYVFVTSFTGPGLPTPAPYVMILDNQGEPVYYHRQPPNQAGTDFKKQPDGTLTYYDRSVGAARALDDTYATVKLYRARNHWTNHHDFQLLPNGNQLYLIYDPQTVDMSQIAPGGYPTATVYGLIVQELDASRNVVFQWRSWDHFEITDTNVSLTDPVIDYVHGNAVGKDLDGNIVISSRHLDEVTKINRQTGDVIWRWGGKRNQFTFVDDPRRFSYLHDVRVLPNGHFTLYDNGNTLVPEYSRALEYVLDQAAKTATLVWEYRNTPDTFGAGMGNAQRLRNGNTMIGWGTTMPTLTEVTPDGRKAFELTMDLQHQSYRAFRFRWTGHPTWPPALVSHVEQGRTHLVTSWNGATEVASYRVYGGAAPGAVTSPIRTLAKTGFETSIDVTAQIDEFCYFRVLPLGPQGEAMIYSNIVAVRSARCRFTYLPLVGQ